MAVQSDISSISYFGNNSTTSSYAVPFVFQENNHLKAIARTGAGVETVVTLTNHTGAGSPNGGTVRTAVAVPATSTLTIYREVPFTQTTSYQEGGDFPAASHERALDKLTMAVQQVNEDLSRALRVTRSGASAQPLVREPNKIVATDGQGDFVLSNVSPQAFVLESIVESEGATMPTGSVALQLTASRGKLWTIASFGSGVGVILPAVNASVVGDRIILRGGNPVLSSISVNSLNADNPATTINTTGDQFSFTLLQTGTGPRWVLNSIDSHNANRVNSGTFANARINWASPSAIGSTAPAAATFTNLSLTGQGTAPNQTAATPASIMTRSLVDAQIAAAAPSAIQQAARVSAGTWTDTVLSPYLGAVTGTSSVTGQTVSGGTTNAAASPPSGLLCHAFRLNVLAIAASRISSDLAVIQGNLNSAQSYYSGKLRGLLDWSTPKAAIIKLASPSAGFGMFTFGVGYNPSLTLPNTVASNIPIMPQSGFGFTLERSGVWIPRIFGRLSSDPSTVFSSSGGTTLDSFGNFKVFAIEYTPPRTLRLYLLDPTNDFAPTLLVEHVTSADFATSSALHNVNWLAGIAPLSSLGAMTYDVTPPAILY